MKSVKRSDICEEVRYIVSCPNCGGLTEVDDDSGDDDVCRHCNEEFEIED